MSLGITNPTEKYFKDGQWTFDGTVWRPQNQLLAYRDVVRQTANDPSCPGGLVVFNLASVPTGEVWVIENVSLLCDTHTVTVMYLQIISGGIGYYVFSTVAPVVHQFYNFTGQLTMKAADYLRASFLNPAVADYVSVTALGHKFLIAE